MLWNLIIGAAAGYLTPMAEPHIKRIIGNLAQAELPIAQTEFDMLSLLLMLMGAAVLVALVGGDSSAFLLCLGALGGVFGKRIYRKIMNPDTGDDD